MAKLKLINGIFFPPLDQFTQQGIDELAANFTVRPDDVFIVTYPKCGTTWCQQIVKLIRGNGIDTGHVSDVLPWLERVGNAFSMAMQSPRSFKSHLPYHAMPGGEPAKSAAKYIYVTRNPKDAAVSFYYHHLRIHLFLFDGDWNSFFELFMKGEVQYGSWFDHNLEWWQHRGADNIMIIKFEDMLADLRGCVEKIAQFIGHQIDDNMIDHITEQCTFDGMKANPLADPDEYKFNNLLIKDYFIKPGSTSFFRKGVVGDWRNHFSDEQSSRLDEEYAKRMDGSGLEFKTFM
jgi:hypothetical protein